MGKNIKKACKPKAEVGVERSSVSVLKLRLKASCKCEHTRAFVCWRLQEKSFCCVWSSFRVSGWRHQRVVSEVMYNIFGMSGFYSYCSKSKDWNSKENDKLCFVLYSPFICHSPLCPIGDSSVNFCACACMACAHACMQLVMWTLFLHNQNLRLQGVEAAY